MARSVTAMEMSLEAGTSNWSAKCWTIALRKVRLPLFGMSSCSMNPRASRMVRAAPWGVAVATVLPAGEG